MSRRSRGNWLAPLVMGSLLGAVGTAGAVKFLRARRAPVSPPAALTVNGQSVSMGEFEGVLKLASGSQVLQGLVEERLVEQEAERRKLRLTAEEEAELEKAARKLPNADLAVIALRRARTALLEKRLLLQGVEESTLREIYDQFKPQLVQYEVFVIVLASRKDGQHVARGLQDGIRFDLLARDLSLDPSKAQGGRLGNLTLPKSSDCWGSPWPTRCVASSPIRSAVPCFPITGWWWSSWARCCKATKNSSPPSKAWWPGRVEPSYSPSCCWPPASARRS